MYVDVEPSKVRNVFVETRQRRTDGGQSATVHEVVVECDVAHLNAGTTHGAETTLRLVLSDAAFGQFADALLAERGLLRDLGLGHAKLEHVLHQA